MLKINDYLLHSLKPIFLEKPQKTSHQSSKLAFFTHKLDTYGIGRVLFNLAVGFATQGWQIDIVVSEKSSDCHFQFPENVNLVVLSTPRRASDLSIAGLFEFTHYLKQAKPKAVIAFTHYNNEIAILAKYLSGQNTKVIVSDHTILSETTKVAVRKTRRLIPKIARWLYPLADARIAVSQAIQQDLAKIIHLSPDHIQVIYNPIIEPKIFNQSKAPIDHPWFTAKDRPIILAIGRLAYEKDFRTLIHAFAKVNQQIPSRLVILGEGREQEQLLRLISELQLTEDVLFPGFVENPYAYIAKTDLLTVSSRWEGLSNVVIEALAFQLPIVSTQCGGPAEILNHGEYGTLVPIGDALAMSQAIVETLQQGKPQIPESWLTQFTLSAAVFRYLTVISEAVGETSPPQQNVQPTPMVIKTL